MSLAGLPAIRVDLSVFTPEQRVVLERILLAVVKNDNALAGQFSSSSAGGGLTANRALKSDASGGVAVATTTATELGYVNGVTSAIQTQLGLKAPLASPALTGNPTAPTQAALSNDTKIATDAYVDSAVGVETARATAAESAIAAVPTGTILAYGGTTAPTGYVLCDGTSYLRAGTYANLFAAIGTAYGTADGTHFNVPDFRGKFIRGTDSGAGNDPNAGTRTAAKTGGATGDNVGSVQAGATKLPVTPFTTSDPGTHQHPLEFNVSTFTLTGTSAVTSGTNYAAGAQSGAAGAHTHTIGGGDAETRPINGSANFIIKI